MSYNNLNDIEIARSIISPPGDTLIEVLNDKGISQAELARRMDRPTKTVNELVKGLINITPETAIQLERTLDVSADFWLERDRNYQLELAELNEAEEILKLKDWLRLFPINEMKNNGFLVYENSIQSKAKNLLSFFGVSSKSGFEKYYNMRYTENAAFKMSEVHDKNLLAVTAWLRRGEIQSEEIDCGEYKESEFKECLNDIKNIMAEHKEGFFDELQSLCLSAGVKVVHTPKLPKAPMDGSTRWHRGNPLIQLSNRYQRNDIFWFTFFHEVGHILKHGRKDVFIEGFEYTKKGKEKEEEANQVAMEWTFPKTAETEFLDQISGVSDFSRVKEIIYSCANKYNTHPGIILGRLAHNETNMNNKKQITIIGFEEGFFQKVVL